MDAAKKLAGIFMKVVKKILSLLMFVIFNENGLPARSTTEFFNRIKLVLTIIRGTIKLTSAS